MARIAGVNIPQNKVIHVALTYIHGIGNKFSNDICSNCGRIFNEFFYPATINNHTCENKFLEKRSDDNEATIINRIETYRKETSPVLNYYKTQNLLHEVNGMKQISDLFKEIHAIIESLEGWL